MAKRRKAWAIPKSKYASTRRRRARHTKVRILVHYGRQNEYRRDKIDSPLRVKEWTRTIDTALARIAKPPKPAQGYKRPVHDPRAKHQTPPTWTYGWIASSTEMATRSPAAA